MNVHYDSRVIEAFADRLYARAWAVVALYTFRNAAMGLLIGGTALWLLVQDPIAVLLGAAAGACALGPVGYSLGSWKVLELRLQAQLALCQAQIERNTRAYLESRRWASSEQPLPRTQPDVG